VNENLFRRYQEYVENNKEQFARNYRHAREKLKESSARYLGQPIDFLLQPMFLSGAGIEALGKVIDKLTAILDKTVNQYRNNPAFREVFPFTELEEELILSDSGYGNPYPIGRFDVFFDLDGRIQFCEFNTDGSAGMNEARVLQQVFLELGVLDFLNSDNDISTYSPMENLVDTLLENYRNFPGAFGDPQTVAIVDFEGEGISSEFREFRRKFEDRGMDCIIADPRELAYSAGELVHESERIDLVYRRATTRSVVDRADEVEGFLRAYLDGAVPVVGGFSSQIVHNKSLFAILQEDEYTDYLDGEEKEFLNRHLPETYIYDRHPDEVRKKLAEKKDAYLLKPFDKFAGHGVYVGREMDRTDWEEKLEDLAGQNYIAQAFCDVPGRDFLYFQDGEAGFQEFGFLIGLYLYNQELSGLYTRAGRENVIASLVECFSLPTFIVESDSAG